MDEGKREASEVTVVIDGLSYRVRGGVMQASHIRAIPHPPIGPDRDIWLEVPDGSDRFLADQESVDLNEGVHFFTAPQMIMAGATPARRALL